MSCIQGYVNACYRGFTPEQIDFMCNIYERYRLFSSETDLCFIDLIVEFNDNPSDIKIHVENNGVYYYEEDGANYATNERVVLQHALFNGPGVSLLYSILRHNPGMLMFLNNFLIFSFLIECNNRRCKWQGLRRRPCHY